jgi:hypothetical protein
MDFRNGWRFYELPQRTEEGFVDFPLLQLNNMDERIKQYHGRR